MRKKILAIGLVAVMGLGSAGCQTVEKLAWWKTAENSAAESAVLAHSAPALPADLAKQAEGFAANQVNITPGEVNGGGSAAPYVPNATVPPANAAVANNAAPAYPSTGVGSYTAAVPPQTSVVAAARSANLGSVAMPYNPNAVPAAPAATSAPAPPISSGIDRYTSAPASHSTPAFNAAAVAATPQPSNFATRYEAPTRTAAPAYTMASPSQQSAATTPPVNTASVPGTPGSPATASGDRYGSYGTPAAAPATPAFAQNTQNTAITPTPSAAPYRPGGTSDYPTRGAIELATRPAEPVGTNATPDSAANNPSGQSTPSPAPRYR
ncbi:MAG: hypothetical protein MI725_07585 [Pirellulales bacterium]|nr:hypothetical protein [Pirellulales bacterium]